MNSLARLHRLQKIRDLLEKEYTEEEISNELSVSVRTVQRLKKDLRAMQMSDLTPLEVTEKRAEVYLDLIECIVEAKTRYEECVGKKDNKYAKLFLETWINTIMKKAKLFGLDKVAPNTAIQINTVTTTPRQVDPIVGMEISKDIKSAHEGEYSDE